MNNRYIITSNGAKPGYYLARSNIDRFTVRDFIAPLYREYGGRLSASQALIFNSKEEAQKYLDRHYGIIPDTWKITKYNVCCNCVEV